MKYYNILLLIKSGLMLILSMKTNEEELKYQLQGDDKFVFTVFERECKMLLRGLWDNIMWKAPYSTENALKSLPHMATN